MTGREPMHRHEMLELAALEAYGLLDEYESALFNRSFHNAPASVQQEIVKLQEQLASDTSVLPTDEPPESLRERVLAAVNHAIEQETPAPIASIGRRTAMDLAEASDHRPMTVVESRLTRSGQFWRAASFLLAATSIVLAYVLSLTMQQHHEFAKLALDNNTKAQVEQLIGPTFKEFMFNGAADRFVFQPNSADDECRAVLYLIEGEDKAILVTERMPDLEGNQLLTLRMRDADGRSHTLAHFESHDALAGTHIDLRGVAMDANVSWEIAGPDGTVMTA